MGVGAGLYMYDVVVKSSRSLGLSHLLANVNEGSATCPDWFCSTSYAEIPVPVVESEIRVADFSRWRHCVINLMRLKLTVVMKTKGVEVFQNHTNWFRRFEDASS